MALTKTIGEVDFIVDLDGSVIPAQARRIGQEAGAIAGKEFNRGFQGQMGELESSLRKRFRALGTNSGNDFGTGFRKALTPGLAQVGRQIDRSFSNSSGLAGFRRELTSTVDNMDDMVLQFEEVDGVFRNVNDRAREGSSNWREYRSSMGGVSAGLRDVSSASDDTDTRTHRLSRTFASLRSAVSSASSSFGGAIGNLTGFGDANDRAARSNNSLLGSFRQLPHGIKQAIFYVSLFASLGAEIAILGSVAGSSLAVLLTSFLALGAGAGIAAIGFQGMLGPLSELGPNAAAASIALREIGTAFASLQDGIREELFRDMAEPFRQIAAIAPQIQLSLNGVAGAVRDVMAAMAEALSSARGIEVMNALLTGFGPIIRELGNAFIALGAAMGTIFVAALPSTQAFASSLNELFTRFNAFLQSAEGQTALSEFFQTLSLVMPPIVNLLGSVGKLLASLVTPATIALFVQTLDTLSLFMPALSGILLVIANLNPIGILAEVLNTIGQIITPLIPAFMELGSVIRDGLMAILPMLIPPLTELVGAIVEALIPAFISLMPAIMVIVSELLPALVEVLLAVIPVIPPLAEFIAMLAVRLSDLAVMVIPIVIAVVEGLVAVLQFLLTPIGEAKAGFEDFKNGLTQNIADLNKTVNDWFAKIFQGFKDFVTNNVQALNDFANGAKEAVQKFVTDGVNGFNDFANKVKTTVRQFATEVGQNISNMVTTVLTFFSNLILQGVQKFNDLRDRVVNTVMDLFFRVRAHFEALLQVAGNIFSNLVEKVLGPIRPIAGQVVSFFQGIPNGISSIVDRIVGFFTGLPGRVMNAIGNLAGKVGGALSAAVNIKLPFTAVGGTFDKAQARIIGEAGPEAVVPLNRPLSRVDPSVRALSAFAQGIPIKGKQDSNMGTVDSRRQVTVAEGAIRVYSPDAKYSGVQVLDQLVENL